MKKVISAVIVIVLFLGVTLGTAWLSDGFKNWDVKHWFDKEKDAEQAADAWDGEGSAMESGKTYAMPSSMYFAAPTAAEENGADGAAAADGVTLSATVSPSTATNKLLNWSVEWVNADAEWARGKNPTDYVTAAASADTMSATVKCLAPFGEQLAIKATSRSNPSLFATCAVDYYQRIINFGCTFDLYNYKLESDEPIWGSKLGTVVVNAKAAGTQSVNWPSNNSSSYPRVQTLNAKQDSVDLTVGTYSNYKVALMDMFFTDDFKAYLAGHGYEDISGSGVFNNGGTSESIINPNDFWELALGKGKGSGTSGYYDFVRLLDMYDSSKPTCYIQAFATYYTRAGKSISILNIVNSPEFRLKLPTIAVTGVSIDNTEIYM